MDLLKDQTVQILLLSLIFFILLYIVFFPRSFVEGFQAATIPVDAENANLKLGDLYGLVPAEASALLFEKVDAREKLSEFNQTTKLTSFNTVDVELNTSTNDITAIVLDKYKSVKKTDADLAKKLEVAKKDALILIENAVKDKFKKGKPTDPEPNLSVKSLKPVEIKITSNLKPRVGAIFSARIKNILQDNIRNRIGEIGAMATALGAAQTATDLHNPLTAKDSKFISYALTLLGVVGVSLENKILKDINDAEGMCPAGYERLDKSLPPIIKKLPNYQEIIDVLGPYACYRDSCEKDQEDQNDICYPKCDDGYTGRGIRCTAKSGSIGEGVMRECPKGWKTDGDVCRQPIQCNTMFWDGCCKQDKGKCIGCMKGGDCEGGKVIKRDNKTLSCPATHPIAIDTLCYKECPKEMPNRLPNKPDFCSVAKFEGDGRNGGSFYSRGTGKLKLSIIPVEIKSTGESPPPSSSSASFAETKTVECKVDYSSTPLLTEMCQFYYTSAFNANDSTRNITFSYISRISRVVASSELTCDVLCDITTVTLPNRTSKTPTSTTVAKDKSRRFYFTKVNDLCVFLVTAATNIDNTGKEITFPNASPVGVNFTYNPFV
jgi:hypothetical protein